MMVSAHQWIGVVGAKTEKKQHTTEEKIKLQLSVLTLTLVVPLLVQTSCPYLPHSELLACVFTAKWPVGAVAIVCDT